MVGLLHTSTPPGCSSGRLGPPQSPLALLNPCWHSSIPFGTPQFGLALPNFIQCSIVPFLSTLLLYDGSSSIPSSTSIRSTSISFQIVCLSPLLELLSINGLLHWILPLQSLSALLGMDLRPSISFCTPASLSALPMPTSHTTSGTCPFLVAHLFPPWIHRIATQTSFWFAES